jgi:hypothetical protein
MASLLRRATRHHVAFKPLVRVVWLYIYIFFSLSPNNTIVTP